MRKAGTSRDIPPPLELECLKALWRVGDGTVKDVREVLTESRNLAYTTVMTVLDRLSKRGSVERRKVGRSFVYTPVIDREELRRMAVQELVDSFFDGSRQELLAFLGALARSNGPPSEQPSVEPVYTEPIDTELL